ncbi:DUF3592 domain-containing protein [Flavitalea flava]
MTQRATRPGIADIIFLLLPLVLFFWFKNEILTAVHKFALIHSGQAAFTNGSVSDSDFDPDNGSFDCTINYAVQSNPYVLKETIAIDSTGDLAKGKTVQVRYHKNNPSLATIDFDNNINGYFAGAMLVTLVFFLWALVRVGRKMAGN